MKNTDVFLGKPVNKSSLANSSSGVVMQQLEEHDRNNILMVILVFYELSTDLSKTAQSERERERERKREMCSTSLENL